MTTDPTPLAGESATLEERLRRRTEQVLPDDWQEGLKCPECDMSADRQKCAFELGGGCPRHDPENYDPDPRVEVPDPLCTEAADELARLRADVERLTAANERLERWKKIVTEAPETADRLALAEQVRPIVAVWKDRLEVAEARAERYRVALEKITDAAPRDAEWFQFVARRALTEGAAPNPSNSSNSSTAATEGADHAEH